MVSQSRGKASARRKRRADEDDDGLYAPQVSNQGSSSSSNSSQSSGEAAIPEGRLPRKKLKLSSKHRPLKKAGIYGGRKGIDMCITPCQTSKRRVSAPRPKNSFSKRVEKVTDAATVEKRRAPINLRTPPIRTPDEDILDSESSSDHDLEEYRELTAAGNENGPRKSLSSGFVPGHPDDDLPALQSTSPSPDCPTNKTITTAAVTSSRSGAGVNDEDNENPNRFSGRCATGEVPNYPTTQAHPTLTETRGMTEITGIKEGATNEPSAEAAIIRQLLMHMEKRLSSKLETVLQTVKDGLQDTLSKCTDLRTDFAQISTLGSGKDKARHTRKTERDKLLDQTIFQFDIIFSDSLSQRVVERCALGFCSSAFTKGNFSLLTGQPQHIIPSSMATSGAGVLAVLFFSRLPSEPKEKFATRLGERYSKYRHGIALTTLRAVQHNSLGTFSDCVIEEDGSSIEVKHVGSNESSRVSKRIPTMIEERPKDGNAHKRSVKVMNSTYNCQNSSGAGINTPKIKQPRWASPGYVKESHMHQARKKHEEVSGKSGDAAVQAALRSSKVQKIAQISRDEVALHATNKLYSLITNVLHRCRDNAKSSFFQAIGYLFTPWELHGSKISQKDLKFEWGGDDPSENMPTFASLPVLRESSIGDSRVDWFDDEQHPQDKENIKKWSAFLCNHPEMILIVSHEVDVRRLAHQRNVEGSPEECFGRPGRGSVQRRVLKKAINLIDTACHLLSCYTGLGSDGLPSRILCVDKHALATTYAFAVFFRHLLISMFDKIAKEGVNDMYNAKLQCTATLYGLAVHELCPTPSKQKELLVTKCLAVTEEEYKMTNIQENGTVSNNTGVENGEGGDRNGITADEEELVFEL